MFVVILSSVLLRLLLMKYDTIALCFLILSHRFVFSTIMYFHSNVVPLVLHIVDDLVKWVHCMDDLNNTLENLLF